MTTYTWDEAKRHSNLRKHGLDFADAHAAFNGKSVTYEDTRYQYDEQRFNTLGMLRGEVVIVSYTEQDDEIRIITFRRANKHETIKFYRQQG
jgi:uncharacterized DUF497 family protein